MDSSLGISEQEYEDIVIPEIEASRRIGCLPWSSEDITILQKYYPQTDIPTTAIARHLKRTVGAVQQKAASLGLLRV